jgi:hypothetical protein
MKHLFQVVTFFVVVLFAVPPGLVQALCLSAGQQASMECCEAGGFGAPHSISSVVQNCHEGWCSVVPQSPPTPSVPEKFKTDAAGFAASDAGMALTPQVNRELTTSLIALPDRAQDLPVLLQSLRI